MFATMVPGMFPTSLAIVTFHKFSSVSGDSGSLYALHYATFVMILDSKKEGDLFIPSFHLRVSRIVLFNIIIFSLSF